MAYQVIGKPIPAVDGPAKVSGEARFTADYSLPGMIWGKSLHSPHAYARILRIDTSKAKALPGVHAVITAADIPESGYWGRMVKDVPVLARQYVRFIGERVASVAAADEDICQQAIDLIEVDYEVLEPVLEPEAAMAPGATVLHPDFNTYVGFPQKQETPSNVFWTTHLERGDLDAGFAEADVIVENTYVTHRTHQGYLEPMAILVEINKEQDRVNVWLCSKVPYNTRESLAFAASEPEERFLFHNVYIGGDFGGKGNSRITPVAYFLAKASGRPVKMVCDYIEELGAGNPKHKTITHLRTGVKRDGTLVAHTVMYIVDSGAYAGFKPFGRIGGADQAAGPYRIPNCRIDSRFVYTNNLPGGFMRAPGEPQGVWAIESHLDEVAAKLGIDPLTIRLKNLVVDGDETAFGERLEKVRAIETMQAAADAGGFGKPKPKYIGRGIAIGDRATGAGEGTAAITLKPDGSVVIGTPIYDQGSNIYTLLSQVTSEEMQIPIDRMSVEVWDSDALPFDSGVAGSRSTRVNTIAAYQASLETKRALFRLAAEKLGWPEDKLSYVEGQVRCTDPEETIGWQDLVALGGEPVTGQASVKETGRSHITSFAAELVEVSVDPETGEVKLLNFTAAIDAGQVMNPINHQGQINGAIMQGIGYAMIEELKIEDGRVTTLSFGDYKLPTTQDIPPLTTVLLESQDGLGPYNIRGIGESPITPVAPAIANAVADAVGVRIRELPITAEKVYAALKAQGGPR